MTATKSSLDKTPIVTRTYIGYSIKRLWAVALLIFIALFFTTSVPLMMSLENVERYNDQMTPGDIRERLEDIAYGTTVVSVIVSSFAAFFTGCSALSFLHNKVSAGFYHSLPERRSGHYLASLIASVAVYIGPALLNTLIIFLTYLTNGYLYGYVVYLIWQFVCYSVFYYIVFLAVSFLAGMLSGSTPIHAIMSFYIIFILPTFFFASFIWIEMGVTYMRTDAWEWTASLCPILTPVFRMSEVLSSMDSANVKFPMSYLLTDTVISAALFFIAYKLYEKRPVERAGTPIIYKPVGEAVKYSIMFPVALLAGYLFGEMGGFIWLVFGTIAGAVLSFMLMNTILNRTAKAMFSGAKGFGIFAVTTFVLLIIFVTGVFGYVDYHVPTAKDITVYVDGDDYSLTNDEIQEFRALMKEFNRGLQSGEINRNVEFYDDYKTSEYMDGITSQIDNIDPSLNEMIAKGENLARRAGMTVEYTNYIGVTTTYRYNNFKYSDMSDILALIAKSEAHKERLPNDKEFVINDIYFTTIFPDELVKTLGVFEGTLRPDDIGVAGYEVTVNFYSHNGSKAFPEETNRRIIDYIRARSTEAIDKQSIGYFSYSIHTNNDTVTDDSFYGCSGNTPLYAEDVSTILGIISENIELCDIHIRDKYTGEDYFLSGEKTQIIFDEMKKLDADDYVDEMTENIKYAVVINNAEKTVSKISDKDMLRAVVASASQITSDANISSFAPTDSDYTVLFVYNGVNTDAFAAYFYPDNIPSFLK